MTGIRLKQKIACKSKDHVCKCSPYNCTDWLIDINYTIAAIGDENINSVMFTMFFFLFF